MRVSIKHIKCDMSKKDKELVNDFIKYLQKKYPVKNDVTVLFLGGVSDTRSYANVIENLACIQ